MNNTINRDVYDSNLDVQEVAICCGDARAGEGVRWFSKHHDRKNPRVTLTDIPGAVLPLSRWNQDDEDIVVPKMNLLFEYIRLKKSSYLYIVGHFDCGKNSEVTTEEQVMQITHAVENIKSRYGERLSSAGIKAIVGIFSEPENKYSLFRPWVAREVRRIRLVVSEEVSAQAALAY